MFDKNELTTIATALETRRYECSKAIQYSVVPSHTSHWERELSEVEDVADKVRGLLRDMAK